MMENNQIEAAEIGIRLLDDAYLAWISAESDCEGALQVWFGAGGARRAAAYLTYRAALDREEAAARDLQRLWQLSEPFRSRLTTVNRSV
jgi:hypothetical protein